MKKTKPIQKKHHQEAEKKSRHPKAKKPVTNEEGDPIINKLSDFVTSVKVDYSSKALYTGGRILASIKYVYSTCNNQICVFNHENGQVVDRIKHMGEEIVNFCVCPEEKYIVTFTQNSMVRVLLLETKKLLHTVKLNGNFANDIQFSPNGRHIAFAFGNSVHIFTFETMKRTHTYNPTNSKFVITKLQWHPNPDKLQIITCDMQRNIAVFDYIINKVVAISEVGEGGTQFCVSPNGENLVAINNMEVKFYDAGSLALKKKVTTTEYFQSIFFISQSQILIGGTQTQLHYLNISNPSKITPYANMTDNGVAKILRIGSQSKCRILVVSSQQNISVLRHEKNKLEYEGMIVGFNDEIIDIKNNKLENGDAEGDEQQEKCKYFVMVTNSNNIKIINKNNHRLQYLVKGHTNTVLCVDFWFPYIASAGKDNILKLWKIKDEHNKVQLLANYKGHSGDIVSLVCLPKSKIVCTVSEDLTIKLWPLCLQAEQKIQIKSSIRTAVAHQKSINAVRVSPSEQFFVTCSQDRTLKIWNHYLTNTLTLAGHKRGVWDAAFHPVQKMIVSAGGDGMIKGWSLETGECLWSMGEGVALIRCCWIYYNQVVTGSLSGVLKIWDIRKQTSISYDKHEGKIWALDIQNKKKKAVIYTGATDSTYHIWRDNTQEMKQAIMHENEEQEQQRLFYEQHLADKKYCDAAVIAFKANYTKLFLNALEQVSCSINPEANVDFDADGRIMVGEGQEGQESGQMVGEEEFRGMVKKLMEIDQQRLLHHTQAMISTIKLYKVGNRILLQIWKQTKLNQFFNLNSTFRLPQLQGSQSMHLEEFSQKKTPFIKWLQSLIGNQCKHMSRLDKYVRGTHWIQHLYKVDHPFSA